PSPTRGRVVWRGGPHLQWRGRAGFTPGFPFFALWGPKALFSCQIRNQSTRAPPLSSGMLGDMLAVTPRTTPERPATVPPDAVFSKETWQWERAALDGEGRRDGLLRAW